MTRRKPLILVPLALAATAGLASAEVSAQVSDGRIDRVEVRIPAAGRIWASLSEVADANVLNPRGDLLGDPPPTCGILSMPMDDPANDDFTAVDPESGSGSPTDPITIARSALVVWPRYDGIDYDLIYSMWHPTRQEWTPPARVIATDDWLDDVSPFLLIGIDRIYLAWQHHDRALLVTGTPKVENGVPAMQWSPSLPIQTGVLIDGIDFWQLLCNSGRTPTDGSGGRGR
jgi:hypothetical protein